MIARRTADVDHLLHFSVSSKMVEASNYNGTLALTITPLQLSWGCVKVGESCSQQITIKNDCSFRFHVKVR